MQLTIRGKNFATIAFPLLQKLYIKRYEYSCLLLITLRFLRHNEQKLNRLLLIKNNKRKLEHPANTIDGYCAMRKKFCYVFLLLQTRYIKQTFLPIS